MSEIINLLKHLYTFAIPHNYPRPRFLPFDFRLSIFGMLLTFSLLTTQSCGLDIEDPTPPSPPVWVQKSLPEEWPEHGIDAHESGGIVLEWEAHNDPGIIAYWLYRASLDQTNDSLGNYLPIVRIPAEAQNNIEYVDFGARVGWIYFYKLKTENASNILSSFSDSLRYKRLPFIHVETMTPNGLIDTLERSRKLTWRYRIYNEMEDYTITILDQHNELVKRINFLPTTYIDGDESLIIPEGTSFENEMIYKWRVDTGANYVDENETAGSESSWATFIFIDDN
jgi:hypothetical protein